MVAILLLSIAIIPMVSMFDAGLRAAVLGSNYDKGRAIASEELAEIQALPFSSPDPEPASGTANSVVEIYTPSNVSPVPTPSPPADYACTPPVPSAFACRVKTEYVKDVSGIVADGSSRTMIQTTITVTWGGGGKYITTGLVSKRT